MAWKVIDQTERLYDGDVVRLHFKATGFTYLTAAQVALIEQKVAKDQRFHILRHSIPKNEGYFKLTEFTVDCEVDTPGVSGTWLASSAVATGAAAYITAKTIAAVILAAVGVSLVMLTLVLTEKLVETAGEAAQKSTETIQAIPPVIVAAIAGYIIVKVLK